MACHIFPGAGFESFTDNVWHHIFEILHTDAAQSGNCEGNAISQLAQANKVTAQAVRRCRPHVKYRLTNVEDARLAGSAFSCLDACHSLALWMENKAPATCSSVLASFLLSSGQQQRARVQELEVLGDDIDCAHMLLITQMLSNVQSFTTFTGFATFANESLAAISSGWPSLHTLHCGVPSLGTTHIAPLASLTSLTKLVLNSVCGDTPSPATIHDAAVDALAALTMLTNLKLDFGTATRPPASWDFLTGMTRLEELTLVQGYRNDRRIPQLKLDGQLAKPLSALPALHTLGVPPFSLTAGGAGQQGGSAQVAEGAGACWCLPSLRHFWLTGTHCVLTCTDIAALAQRVPNAQACLLPELHLNASRHDTPEQLQRMLRSLKYLDMRGWLDVQDAPLIIEDPYFSADAEQLERACKALCVPPSSTAGDAAGEGTNGPVLTNPVRRLQVRCEFKPAHMSWLAAFMPCVREIECSWDLLAALPDLSAMPCLESLDLFNPYSMDDPWTAKEELAADVCAALSNLRVPPGRVVTVKCYSVLLPGDARLPAVCLASCGLRLIDE